MAGGSVGKAVSAVLHEPIPVGTRVLAWTMTRNGSPLVTRTRSQCWSLGDGTRVVKVEGHVGGIALTHIDVLPTSFLEEVARLGRVATLDPGQFVKRHRDEDGEYERLDQWQERALMAAITEGY